MVSLPVIARSAKPHAKGLTASRNDGDEDPIALGIARSNDGAGKPQTSNFFIMQANHARLKRLAFHQL